MLLALLVFVVDCGGMKHPEPRNTSLRIPNFFKSLLEKYVQFFGATENYVVNLSRQIW